MATLHVYSSAPVTTSLACIFQHLSRLGMPVVVQPLEAMPPALVPSRSWLRMRREERDALCQLLANIGLKLDRHEEGLLRLDAGEEQGLRAERDALQSRLRGVEAALRAPAVG